MENSRPASSIPVQKLYEIFSSFKTYSLNYVYKGIFDPALTDKILALAENNMNITGESSKTQKKVYFVMVESLQNITRHQDLNQTMENHAFFAVQNKSGEYDMASGNVIDKNKEDELKEKIDKINTMSPDELKEYHKYVLENTGMSEKGGAGLGLIEMARRSGNKLNYDFEPVTGDQSYFYFKSKVCSGACDGSGGYKMMDEVKSLHKFTQDSNIHMIYQGIFTQENLKSLLSMTEGSMSHGTDIAYKRKAVNIMVELLQNICKHAAATNTEDSGKPGMVLVSRVREGCYFASGNYIGNENCQTIINKIDRINGSSEEELDDLYSEMITREIDPSQKGAGLGFIDMRMKSGGELQYHLMQVDEKLSFISINIFIPF